MSKGNRIVKAAGLIAVAMIISRILGYVRDVVIYYQFGQNQLTDAYNAAFSIPDTLYTLLVGGALSSSFIPVISSYIATNREDDAWEVASIIFNWIVVLMLVGISLGMIFTRQLVYIMVPGFDAQTAALTVYLTRLMFIQTFFMAFSGLAMGILNSYKHFTAPAVGSILYNLGIITVGVLLSPRMKIAAFSLGVVAGAAANFAVQLPALLRHGLKYRLSFNLRHPGVKKVGTLMIPVLFGLSVAQFNLFVNQNLASHLPEGLLTALRAAQRLMQLPIGVFAIAVAVAVFPTLTGYAARGEMEQFKRTMSMGIRSVMFITLPSAAGLIALGVPIIRFLFEQGRFTSTATQATAIALFYYSLGLFAYSGLQVLNRAYYALQDTRTPVTIGVITIGLNIILNILLVKPMSHGGLALASSLAGIFNITALLFLLQRKIGAINGRQIISSFFKSVFASALMGLGAFGIAQALASYLNMSSKFNQALQLMVSVTVGVGLYAVIAYLLRMEEIELVMEMFRKRLRRPRTV
ncbi:MAG: murein biosynthesis integral membrane protein MurJ [Bacillota bacterium]